jgi:uroporphyrin-III C-methyltransferase / precorrin-2 dehydrogenase / sirohydrochlorin ferrochelatase
MSTPRVPELSQDLRIDSLSVLPIFYKLRGEKVLLVGTGKGALWKAELLAAAGPELLVVAEENAESFEALAGEVAKRHAEGFGTIRVVARHWQKADIESAKLAIADISEEEAQEFADAARKAGVPVNIVDKPRFCDFQFGTIVNRSPAVIGISTDGAAPPLGQAIRARIEALLPRGLKAWAVAAKTWRPSLSERGLEFAQRKRFWQLFAQRAFHKAEMTPDIQDREDLIDIVSRDAESIFSGQVTLVGAGPGNPDFLTMGGLRALQMADVILYDDLVSDDVLELARREADRINVGKAAEKPSCKQEDIVALMLEQARNGKKVVRLKGGDPLVFGRAAEELAACRNHGFSVQIIPGISAAQAAAASLGVPLTERGLARRVQFITGHTRDGLLPEEIAPEALADPQATTVVYMPRRNLSELSQRMLAAGAQADLPAVAIIKASMPDEEILSGTVGALSTLALNAPEGPLLIIIGEVLRSRSSRLETIEKARRVVTAPMASRD